MYHLGDWSALRGPFPATPACVFKYLSLLRLNSGSNRPMQIGKP